MERNAMAIAETLSLELEKMPGVRLAVLFGSSARRTQSPRSDIDLGVMLEHGAEGSLAIGVTLERVIGRPIDLVWLDGAPPLLRFEIARDGVLLLERSPHDWADFRARAMIDWWDWAPTAQMMHQVMATRLREEAARGPS